MTTIALKEIFILFYRDKLYYKQKDTILEYNTVIWLHFNVKYIAYIDVISYTVSSI